MTTEAEIARVADFRETCRHAAASGCGVFVAVEMADILARALDEAFAVMEQQNLPDPSAP